MNKIQRASERPALSSMSRAAFTGAIVVLGFFGALGGWAAVAPLQSAALAQGVLQVSSKRKAIQHLEGGIVRQIHVQEGDTVRSGQALIELDATQSEAILEQLRGRYLAALAQEARLVAEGDAKSVINTPASTPDWVVARELHARIKEEARILAARHQAWETQRAISTQRIRQLEQHTEGLQDLLDAQQQEMDAIDREHSGERKLVDQKLTSMRRMLELQRERAELLGERSQSLAQIAENQQQIDAERLKQLERETERLRGSAEGLSEVRSQLVELGQRIRAATDVLNRTTIIAPLDGVVVGLRVHTRSGVVAPGQTLMEIVPSAEGLLVEAQVSPQDIDSISVGQSALVTLTAFSRRNTSPLNGTVETISADRIIDDRSGEPFYLARISLDPTKAIPQDLSLHPGMQTEVMVVTGERTALDYLLQPVLRSFDRALRED